MDSTNATFFDIIAPHYREIFPIGDAKFAFLKQFAIGGRKVLDLACGGSELPEKLADSGFDVTAFDSNERLLQMIAHNKGIRIIRGDFKDIDSSSLGQFDTIFCIGNSLSYAGDMGAFQKLLKDLRVILSPDGHLVTQTINYDKLVTAGKMKMPDRIVADAEGDIIFKREYSYHQPAEIIFDTKIIRGQNSFQNIDRFPLLRSELQMDMMKIAGFTKINIFGDFKDIPFELDSPAIIIDASA
ncbi:MAG: hypothetical protein CO189_11580 [candidate division Zixibacteria bacterium CG_4_9_14_3_um_filter_46_8]|nr:MAG: hypothetical protein CO189_11580 [candidate division Zixibacteria bacterium CG_4_9_14_3_um_filter_46_8]